MNAKAEGRVESRSARRFRWFLAVSLLLHVPATPLGMLLGLARLFMTTETEELPEEQLNEIPIALLTSDLGGDVPPPNAPPEPPATPEEASGDAPEAARPALDAGAQAVLDAGARANESPDAGRDGSAEAGSDAEDAAVEADADADEAGKLADASQPDGESALSDAGADAGGAAPGDAGRVEDPVALSGAAGKVADSNANVRLILYNEEIRKHPLGREIGWILGSLPQWRDFFGPGGIDPIRDVDRMLLAGPQFRDSRNVVAVLRYNVSAERMRRAISAIVAGGTAKGRWLDARVPTALATADRAERLFVMPSANHVVVAPPSVRNSKDLGPKVQIPEAPTHEVAVAYVVTPERVFRGLPVRVDVPKSLAWVRTTVWITPDGGAEMRLRALDESSELASAHARSLEREIKMATQVQLPLLGSMRFIEEVQFQPDGSYIDGRLVMTRLQLYDALGVIVGFIEKRTGATLGPRPPGFGKPPGAGRGPDAGVRERPHPAKGRRDAGAKR